MKIMENYEEKYEQALERARKIKSRNPIGRIQGEIDSIFPELKESEDERIIRTLKEIVNWGCAKNISVENNVELKDCLAWLEKQGEKVDAIENFETEFERQVSGLIASAINKEHEYNQGYVKWTANALLNYAKYETEKQGEQKPTDKVEPKFKVGDWITNGIDVDKIIGIDLEDENYLFENNRKSDISLVDSNSHLWTIQDAKDGNVLAYPDGSITLFKYMIENIYMAHVLWVDGHIELNNSCVVSNVHPATKEQCDFFFQKMKEAGYEWDAEKKKLKKIKQKPVEWSKEDKAILQDAIYFISEYQKSNRCIDEGCMQNSVTCEKWLKSLKDRVQPQPKQEWSEEDEKMYSSTIFYLNEFREVYKDGAQQCIAWLKSLKSINPNHE